ncbi:MAG: F0F1 ATP synthase subunit epsilon [Hominimerdicola sp.]
MGNTFKLDIVASDHVFYSGECDELVFPGLDGSFGILANHEPMITCLNSGEMKYRVGDKWYYASVSEGFVEIMPKFVTILADTVERPEEIDIKRAEAAKQRAEERLRQKQSIKQYYHTQAALNRAMARLKLSSKHGKNINL